ncbi:MAG: ABC transporter permease, partial [Actinobacteria bacterium]|nr:ABC transporter permease [Actinomycetota bacterium]
MTATTVQSGRWSGGAFPRRLASSPSLRVSGRRLLSAIPVLWGVTFLSFMIMNALPGDAASALLGINATQSELRSFRIKLHLDQPLWERYGHWLGGVVTGNLGTSLESPQSVASVLVNRLPVTVELVIYALIITLVVSIPLAVLCARRPGGIIDRLSLIGSMGSISIAPY